MTQTGSDVSQALRRTRVADVELEPASVIDAGTRLDEVCRLLARVGRPAVVIGDDEGIRGIFTQRDVLYRTALEGLDGAMPIGELMTRRPRTVRAEDSLAAALDTMIEGGYRQVPVVGPAGRPAGVVTSRDVLAFVAERIPEAVINLPPRLHQVLRTPEGG